MLRYLVLQHEWCLVTKPLPGESNWGKLTVYQLVIDTSPIFFMISTPINRSYSSRFSSTTRTSTLIERLSHTPIWTSPTQHHVRVSSPTVSTSTSFLFQKWQSDLLTSDREQPVSTKVGPMTPLMCTLTAGTTTFRWDSGSEWRWSLFFWLISRTISWAVLCKMILQYVIVETTIYYGIAWMPSRKLRAAATPGPSSTTAYFRTARDGANSWSIVRASIRVENCFACSGNLLTNAHDSPRPSIPPNNTANFRNSVKYTPTNSPRRSRR